MEKYIIIFTTAYNETYSYVKNIVTKKHSPDKIEMIKLPLTNNIGEAKKWETKNGVKRNIDFIRGQVEGNYHVSYKKINLSTIRKEKLKKIGF